MKIIISPAKKMNVDLDSLEVKGFPVFMEEAIQLSNFIKSLSFQDVENLWNASKKITELNYNRFQNMKLKENLTPAIIAYEGIQYQYMAPSVFDEDMLHYIQRNLRILSGLYGILKPLDGVTPYRLELEARLPVEGKLKSLYQFWNKKIYEELMDESRTVVNLASKEYSKVIEPYLSEEDKMVTCFFGELFQGKIKQKATYAKMARGEMVRYMAEKKVEKVSDVKNFDRLGYEYDEKRSDERRYVFLK